MRVFRSRRNENRSKLVFLVEARSQLKPGQPIDVRLVTVPIAGAQP